MRIAHCPEQLEKFQEARSVLDELRQRSGMDHAAEQAIPGEQFQAVSLPAAYAMCEHITRFHSKSFYFSSQFLPAEKRRAIRALYAFCRTSDDIVDQAEGDPTRALALWVSLVHAPRPLPTHPVLVAWHDTVQRYGIERRLIDELLAGIAMDLSVQRYPSFEALEVYCYRVASVVGLMTMQIVGAEDGAHPYAVQLGIALQLTNILRDIGEDAGRGRVYLPEDELCAYGLSADDVLAGRRDGAFRALIQSQIERAHRLYADAWPGVAMLSRDSRLAVGAAATVYQGILGKIVANDYDVYSRRAHVSLSEKLRILAGLWWRMRAGNSVQRQVCLQK